MKTTTLLIILGTALIAARLDADPFTFNTGNPDGRLATASRTDSPGKIEIESADDFVATTQIALTSATFTGLLPTGFNPANITEVQVEIYRVFPNDSNVGRTTGPPTFGTPQVPTRVNSPSDVAFDTRNSLVAGGLIFSTTVLSPIFTAGNSILNGINPQPNQTTMGEGPVSGQEVQFNVTFTTPFILPADHYFFVPQVELPGTDNFFWLSTPRPIAAPGTPFPPGFTDLQAWIRNANLDPDWLREGTDIVDSGSTFNEAFSLTGQVPDSGSTALLLGSVLAATFCLKRRLRA